MTKDEMPYFDGLEPFGSEEQIPQRPEVCNCGVNLVGQPFYVCITCFAVFCLQPGCAEKHAYPEFKHYVSQV